MKKKAIQLQLIGLLTLSLLVGASGCLTNKSETKKTAPAAPVQEQKPEEINPTDLQANLDKLKDPNFVETTPEGATWYKAAENLGLIGKPAIPELIKKLETADDYERTQTLYALRLAAQHDNVRVFTGGEFPNGSGEAFPQVAEHPELVRTWHDWFTKYKANFE